MKLLLSVIVLLVMSVIAANATNASEEKKEFLHPEYEWVVSEGKPCMVVFEPKKNARIRKTYCFNKEGVLAALLREELDSPTSTRPIIARWLYAFDKYYNVVGIKKLLTVMVTAAKWSRAKRCITIWQPLEASK